MCYRYAQGYAGVVVILEVAILNVVAGQEAEFERAMHTARPLIAASPGFEGIQIHRCIETPNRYLLLVTWRSVDYHTIGFRGSDRYAQWKRLLHHFYEPFPLVEHYERALFEETSS
jgi:heme-degrading monooxygenase HmoA